MSSLTLTDIYVIIGISSAVLLISLILLIVGIAYSGEKSETGLIIFAVIFLILGGVGLGFGIYYLNLYNNRLIPYNPVPPPSGLTVFSSTPTMAQVSIASDGTLLGIDKNQNAQQWTSSTWMQFPNSSLQGVSVRNKTSAYGFNGNGSNNVYAWTGGSTWAALPGTITATSISVGTDGTLMAVGSGNSLFSYNYSSQTWAAVGITTLLSQIAVGNANNICGLTTAGDIVQIKGTSATQISPSGTYVSVTCTNDNSIWAIDNNGNVVQYKNSTWTTIYSKSPLVQISAQNSTNVIGVDSSGTVYTNSGFSP